MLVQTRSNYTQNSLLPLWAESDNSNKTNLSLQDKLYQHIFIHTHIHSFIHSFIHYSFPRHKTDQQVIYMKTCRSIHNVHYINLERLRCTLQSLMLSRTTPRVPRTTEKLGLHGLQFRIHDYVYNMTYTYTLCS
jgi:hypothetical protein